MAIIIIIGIIEEEGINLEDLEEMEGEIIKDLIGIKNDFFILFLNF